MSTSVSAPEANQAGSGGSETNLHFVSLFSGIAGLDSGLVAAGAHVVEMCEYWEPARRVLNAKHPGVTLARDVRDFIPSSEHSLLAAGFPCVDLSHAGKQAGIFGTQSGLVSEVFRIARVTRPQWILLENVPNLLRLGRGAGIRLIIDSVESLGYHWAYRVLDSRAFGVAQRRNRVLFLASRTPGSAAAAMLATDTGLDNELQESADARASGFYWTEGRRGVGLVRGAVPTLKGGSTVGAPSAPAIWRPHSPMGQRIVLPSIEDAEELQGFDRGWTAAADAQGEHSARWKLVGNAVTVGLGKWIGERISAANRGVVGDTPTSYIRNEHRPWPDAAFGGPAMPVRSVAASRWPEMHAAKPLHELLDGTGLRPLSYRATRGFLSRVEESGIKLEDDFASDLESHLSHMRATTEDKTPWASSQAVRSRMQATKQRDTAPEMRLRRALTAHGLRYRLQIRPEPELRWRSDIVFRGPKVVVDVRGCFWHLCPEHRSHPKTNAERWANKLLANQQRDVRMESDLRERGWEVVTVWEHEDAIKAAERITAVLAQRRGRTRSTRTASPNA